MNEMKQYWIDKNFQAMEEIDKLLQLNEEYQKEFVQLANWVYHTNINPWGFMPVGWESVRESAQSFCAFLNQLHHAMVDDGDICFIETEIHGSFIAFGFHKDEAEIKDIYLKKMTSVYTHRAYEAHTDVARFIKHVEKRNAPPAEE